MDERDRPRITIGLTCFNAADTIGRAVESALRQDWPETEILVVDDHSSDDSPAVLDALAARHDRVRYIQHEHNKGFPGALNTICREATGEYIALFDDDDVSAPHRLTAQWERITAYERGHPGRLILCYANRNVIKPGRSEPDHVALAIGRTPPEPHGAMVADYLLGCDVDPSYTWGMFGSCTLFFRTSLYAAVGPFDESFRRSAEWDFAIRAAFLGAHAIAVDAPLIDQHKTAGADKANTIPLQYALQLREKYRAYLEERSRYHWSRAMAHANFWGNKNVGWRRLLWLAAACAVAPHVAGGKIVRKLAGRVSP